MIITENHPVVTITKTHTYDFFDIIRLLSLCASNIFSQKGTHQLLFWAVENTESGVSALKLRSSTWLIRLSEYDSKKPLYWFLIFIPCWRIVNLHVSFCWHFFLISLFDLQKCLTSLYCLGNTIGQAKPSKLPCLEN